MVASNCGKAAFQKKLYTAMIIASEYNVPEVCVLFGSVLLRGLHSWKNVL